MFVDLVGQLNRRYLATAFSSFVGSLTTCRDTTDKHTDEQTPIKTTSQSVVTAGKMALYYILALNHSQITTSKSYSYIYG